MMKESQSLECNYWCFKVHKNMFLWYFIPVYLFDDSNIVPSMIIKNNDNENIIQQNSNK